tara:strand:- start:1066 stop:1629 length:564 start_codon:yes stop_codon:yes gene_type:complete
MNPIQEQRVINQFLKSCGQETIEYNLFTDFLPDDIQDKIYLEAHKAVYVPMIKRNIKPHYVQNSQGYTKVPGTFLSQLYQYQENGKCIGLKAWRIQHDIEDDHERSEFIKNYWMDEVFYLEVYNNIDARINIRRLKANHTKTWLETWRDMTQGKYTVKQLKQMCKMNGLTGYSKLNRRQLIKLMMTC